MFVEGRLNRYKVEIERKGWGLAVPTVKERRKVPLLPISRWVTVWQGKSKSYTIAKKLHPAPYKRWVKDAVDEYETYLAVWEKEIN